MSGPFRRTSRVPPQTPARGSVAVLATLPPCLCLGYTIVGPVAYLGSSKERGQAYSQPCDHVAVQLGNTVQNKKLSQKATECPVPIKNRHCFGPTLRLGETFVATRPSAVRYYT